MGIAVTGKMPNGSLDVVAADDPGDVQLRLV